MSTQTTEQPFLLFRDTEKIDTIIKQHERFAAALRSIVRQVKAVLPNLEINRETIDKIITDPISFTMDSLLDQKRLAIAGMNLNRDAAKAMLQIPNEEMIRWSYNRFLSEKQQIEAELRFLLGALDMGAFDLKDEEFQLTDFFTERITDGFSVYAENDNQVEAFQLLQQAQQALKQLTKYYGAPVEFFLYDRAGKLEINTHMIKGIVK